MTTSTPGRLGRFGGRLAAAVLLLALGALLVQAAGVEERIATAMERQTTAPAASGSELAGMEDTLGVVGRVPFVGGPLRGEIRRRQGEAAYWAGDYEALTSRAAGDDVELDAGTAFLEANALFRQIQQRTPDQSTARALDDVMRRYSVVLQNDPSHVGAAHNYEVVSRLRDSASRGQYADMQQAEPSEIQGEQGSPPQNTQPSDFNVIVPLQPDERQDQFDASEGGTRLRQG